MSTFYAVARVDGIERGTYVEAKDMDHAFDVAWLVISEHHRSALDVEVRSVQLMA